MNITEFDFHDMRLGDINIDYFNHILIIKIENEDTHKTYTLECKNLISFSMSILEPWGAGIYISEVKFVENDTENAVITLNSGDILDIKCNGIDLV